MLQGHFKSQNGQFLASRSDGRKWKLFFGSHCCANAWDRNMSVILYLIPVVQLYIWCLASAEQFNTLELADTRLMINIARGRAEYYTTLENFGNVRKRCHAAARWKEESWAVQLLLYLIYALSHISHPRDSFPSNVNFMLTLEPLHKFYLVVSKLLETWFINYPSFVLLYTSPKQEVRAGKPFFVQKEAILLACNALVSYREDSSQDRGCVWTFWNVKPLLSLTGWVV